MTSGYEKSPDYGGPKPGWKLFVLTAIVAGVVIGLIFIAK